MPLDKDAMREYQRERRARLKGTPPAPHPTTPVPGDEVVPVPKSEVVREIKPKRGVVAREPGWIASMTQAERDAILRRMVKG